MACGLELQLFPESPAYPADFRLASLHNHVCQILRIYEMKERDRDRNRARQSGIEAE
jgi:hypothetical protein